MSEPESDVPRELGERKAAVLRVVVEEYVRTGEPVGSENIAEHAQRVVRLRDGLIESDEKTAGIAGGKQPRFAPADADQPASLEVMTA
jgi:hypothetical protein